MYFKLSAIDPCLYIGNGIIVLLYVDDCIIVGPSMVDIDAFVQSMKNVPEGFILKDEGDIKKYIGIEITHIDEKRFKVSKHFLINMIISLLNTDTNNYSMDTNAKSTPVGKPLVHKDLYGKPRTDAWNYQTEVGMLKYFQDNIRPEMSMAVHQTTRFCNNPILLHEKAINRLGRYLLHSKKEGIK